jgi:CheY-like chemotaxis protein
MSGQYLILIAEDQPHILMALEHLVQSVPDTIIITAQDGPHAVNKALNRKPHLVILAASLPQIDGHLAARMIRDQWDEQNHRGKIWLTAGQLEKTSQTDAQEAGADQIITNPFDPNLVVDLLKQAVFTASST